MLAAAELMALAAAGGPAVSAVSSTAAHVTRFDLVSHGMTVGHGRIIRAPALRDGQPCRTARLVIESEVDLLFFKYSLKLDELRVTDAGGMIAYQLDSVENGRRQAVSGELRAGVFRFKSTVDGQKRIWETPRAAFDLDANSQPGQALAKGAATNLCVLDPAAGAITERIYRGTGQAMLTVGKQQVLCDTVMIEGPGLHIRRWYITDEFGPLILREEGQEKRGPYSRQAVSLGREENPAD